MVEALAEKHGVQLDMGTVKPVSEYVSGNSGESGAPAPEPMDVAPRVVAHIAHRIPGVRKLGKLSEDKGTGKTGILSDITTLIAQVAERNEDLMMSKGLEAIGLVTDPDKVSQQHTQQAPDIRDVVVVDGVPLTKPVVE